MRIQIAVLVVLLLASNSQAQPAPQPGPAPALLVIASTQPEKGQATVTQTSYRIEERAVIERVNMNGKLVDVPKRIKVRVPVQYNVVYDIAAGRVITPDGKQLPIDEVWKRLKKDSVVAISGDFNTPAAPFLRALNANTLVIIPTPPKKEPAPK